jgi:ribose/xylose/arabinose/galactoside ABC-type transport system permease subunit
MTLPISTSRPAASSRWNGRISRHASFVGPILALVVLVLVFSTLAGGSFLTGNNLTNMASQVSVLAIMATGLTFVLLLGQIDLSVANMAAFAGVAMATFFSGQSFGLFLFGKAHFPASSAIALLLPLVLAALLGWVSSLLINRAGIPSFVATLAIYEVASGWALYWSQGNTLYTIPPVVKTLGGGSTGPIPTIVLSAVVVMVVADVVLRRTQFGRTVYMIGANREAALLSGVPVQRVIRSVFVLSAVLSALAGMLNVGRLGSAQAETGSDLLLPAIAAVVLGGTSLFGGVGGIRNTVIGLLIYGVLDNGLDQLDVDLFLKPYIRGLFLILALVLNVVAMRATNRAYDQDAQAEGSGEPSPVTASVGAPAGDPSVGDAPAGDRENAAAARGRHGSA